MRLENLERNCNMSTEYGWQQRRKCRMHALEMSRQVHDVRLQAHGTRRETVVFLISVERTLNYRNVLTFFVFISHLYKKGMQRQARYVKTFFCDCRKIQGNTSLP